jgi:DNA-binding winged helix-turn-helix (wHTH) protein
MFTLDMAAKRVTRRDNPDRLTPTEWHLLEVLTRHPGSLVTGKPLLQEVWGPTYGAEASYLRVHMAQLRRKLESEPSHPRHLITEPGLGYRVEPLGTPHRNDRLGTSGLRSTCSGCSIVRTTLPCWLARVCSFGWRATNSP